MIDADFFKKINDQFGHQAGDTVICKISDLIRQTVRKGDICSRYGGEEFIVLLPQTTIDEAIFVAERIRKSIENLEIKTDEHSVIRVTISAGVANTTPTQQGINSLIRSADQALYQAKENGRNRVLISPH